MTAKAVPTVATAPQVLRALLDAGAPSLTAARVIAAQTALETAGWGTVNGQGFYDWNLGNIKATDANAAILPDGGSYEAYPSLLSGAQALIHWIAVHGGSAMAAADSGDVTGFVTALKNAGYFEAPLASYVSGTESWYRRIAGVTPSPPWIQIGATVAIVGGSAAAIVAIRKGWFDSLIDRMWP